MEGSFDIVGASYPKNYSEPMAGAPPEMGSWCNVAILVSTQFLSKAPPPARKTAS
jgi:hypothetical protein